MDDLGGPPLFFRNTHMTLESFLFEKVAIPKTPRSEAIRLQSTLNEAQTSPEYVQLAIAPG